MTTASRQVPSCHLKGRVLARARVGELDTQFSTTTKLSAKTVWIDMQRARKVMLPPRAPYNAQRRLLAS